MRMKDLMILAEASNGFVGGSNVDAFPDMSLTECASQLPVAILESQLSLHDMVSEQNDTLVEAAVSAITSGTSADFSSITEGAWENLKNKIKAFFDKIVKFISSIIAKIELQINKIRMTGKQMYSKYHDSDALKKDFTGMTFNGYKFGAKNPFVDPASMTDVRKLITSSAKEVIDPIQFANNAKAVQGAGDKKAAVNALQSTLDKMSETTADEHKEAFAKALCSAKINGGSTWAQDVKKELYGDKVDLKYGTDFTAKGVLDGLNNPADLDAVKQAYQKLKTAVEKDRDDLSKTADTFKTDNESKGDAEQASASIALANKYFSAYLSIYQDCTSVITSVQNIRVSFEQEKVKQQKNMLAKMLTFKAEKKNADAADAEYVDDFEIEL